ncbi:unnamed protein product [Phytomonas sp. Hart1]|nr:unnamed protein product [Phytomonas sp. Hart1]|eukprot:CCW67619.1 unnamed protein product [Phytomonas sp. isolate Hart1]
MAAITDIITALGSPDPSVRIPAEQAVNHAKETDLSGFILAVLQEFRDESKPPFVRNMAGTLLKNAVAPSLREVASRKLLEQKWASLRADVRQRVKEQVLITLGCPSREVRNVAANIVGSLSRIELPSGEWKELIGILVSAAESNSIQHQEAALTAIGYVCEEGNDHEDVEEALKPHTNCILSAVVRGMESSDDSVRLSATRALRNAMEYINDNMEKQDQRDYLVNAVCSTAKGSSDVRTRELAMECLVKIAALYYSTLPNYINHLHTITTEAIEGDEEAVALQAMLFWITICETERDMKESDDLESCLKYSTTGMGFLINLCLAQLVKQDENGDGEDEWNFAVAAGKLLQCLAEAVGSPIHEPVMQFVYANINSPEWRQREAALMAFGCILGIDESDAQEAMQDTVAQSIPGLLEYLRDSNPMVADTSAWVVATVCEFFVDVFLHQIQLLHKLMNLIGPMITADNPQMGKRACHIIHNLALAYENEENQITNELTPFYADLISVLLRAIDGGFTVNFRSNAQETLNALVDAAAMDCMPYLTQLVPELHNRIETQSNLMRAQIASNGDLQDMETALGLLCGALGAVARKLGPDFVSLVDTSMRLLLDLIELQMDYVQDEALVAIGSIAYSGKAAMTPYFARIVPYIIRCLQAFDEPDSVYTVVAAVGDLCLACGAAFAPYAGHIMDTLYQNVRNPQVDRDLKCSFVHCFGDLVLNVLGGSGFLPYMNDLMPVFDEMFRASTSIDIRGDPDSEEYVMTLWEATASVYSAIIQSFQKNEVKNLVPYLSGILSFALHAAAKSASYSETLMAVVMVVGDMASVLRQAPDPQLRQQAKQALLTPQMEEVITNASRNVNLSSEDAKQLKWIQTQLKSLQSI